MSQFSKSKIVYDTVEAIIIGMSNEDRGPVETGIRDKLMRQLRPMYLDVINQSIMYEEPESSEKYFAIVIVSSAFIGTNSYQVISKFPIIILHNIF